jgi:chloride channel 3/4/5
LSAAAAAGVSCAFGAPIGGVLFSLEEVSYYFPYKTMLRSFFSAMMAAVTLQVFNPYRTGKLVLFQVTYDKTWHSFELIFFIILGIIGGLFGALFIQMNLWISLKRKTTWLRMRPVQEACTVAMVTALISYLNPYLRVSTDKLVGSLFRECPSPGSLSPDTPVDDMQLALCDISKYGNTIMLLLFGLVAKLALTVVTFGIRVPCGIFIPSMCCGACVGRILGMFVDYIQRTFPGFILFRACQPETTCITVGQYALLGSAAFLAGVTRMTVSLVVVCSLEFEVLLSTN